MTWLKSESQFRRYEPFIRDALSTGNPITVTIPNLARTTTALQLRASVASYREKHWPTSWSPSRHIETLSVFETSEGVILSARGASPATPVDSTPLPSTPTQTLTLTPTELTAFAVLLSSQKLKGPIRFRLDGSIDFNSLETSYDISITPVNETTFIIL